MKIERISRKVLQITMGRPENSVEIPLKENVGADNWRLGGIVQYLQETAKECPVVIYIEEAELIPKMEESEEDSS